MYAYFENDLRLLFAYSRVPHSLDLISSTNANELAYQVLSRRSGRVKEYFERNEDMRSFIFIVLTPSAIVPVKK